MGKIGHLIGFILQNSSGKFYIGQTQNINNRLAEHNQTGSAMGKFTLKNGPWQLVWSERHPDRSSAMKREKQIKSMKSARWIREKLLNW